MNAPVRVADWPFGLVTARRGGARHCPPASARSIGSRCHGHVGRRHPADTHGGAGDKVRARQGDVGAPAAGPEVGDTDVRGVVDVGMVKPASVAQEPPRVVVTCTY